MVDYPQPMGRHGPAIFNPCHRELLVICNADDLKRMLALITDAQLKAPRKGETIEALTRSLMGGGPARILKPLEIAGAIRLGKLPAQTIGLLPGRSSRQIPPIHGLKVMGEALARVWVCSSRRPRL